MMDHKEMKLWSRMGNHIVGLRSDGYPRISNQYLQYFLFARGNAHTKVPSTVIIPSGGAVYEPRWVNCSNSIRESELRISLVNLSPSFVVDNLLMLAFSLFPWSKTYPDYNARIALMLID